MKKFIIILFLSIILNANVNNNFWNDLIVNKGPKNIRESIRVIEKNDILDSDNLYAINKYNPDLIIQYDFKNNGKEDVLIPCVSKHDKKKWYILIFEKEKKDFKYIQYFEYTFESFYIFKRKDKSYVRLGQSFASDYSINIFWDGKKYIEKHKTVNVP